MLANKRLLVFVWIVKTMDVVRKTSWNIAVTRTIYEDIPKSFGDSNRFNPKALENWEERLNCLFCIPCTELVEDVETGFKNGPVVKCTCPGNVEKIQKG